MVLVLRLLLHPPFVVGFSLQGPRVIGTSGMQRQTIRVMTTRTPLRASTEENDVAKQGIDEPASSEGKDCRDPDVECDLASQFELELEEGYARRNPKIAVKEKSYWEEVFDAMLDLVFVRRQNSEGQRKVFLTKRSYARNESFTRSAFNSPPVVEDLLPYPTPIEDSFYLSVPAAVLTFLISSAIFPLLANFMVDFIDIPPGNLEDLNSKLVPGISILYGTFMSLTLSILYNRQRHVQDSVAQETSLLAFLLHNMVFLFRRDRNKMVRAGQCAADQVRILLRCVNRCLLSMMVNIPSPHMNCYSSSCTVQRESWY